MLAVLSVAGAAVTFVVVSSGPTAEDAKRECKTAFIKEMDDDNGGLSTTVSNRGGGTADQ
jgi:hypothetical protein